MSSAAARREIDLQLKSLAGLHARYVAFMRLRLCFMLAVRASLVFFSAQARVSAHLRRATEARAPLPPRAAARSSSPQRAGLLLGQVRPAAKRWRADDRRDGVRRPLRRQVHRGGRGGARRARDEPQGGDRAPLRGLRRQGRRSKRACCAAGVSQCICYDTVRALDSVVLAAPATAARLAAIYFSQRAGTAQRRSLSSFQHTRRRGAPSRVPQTRLQLRRAVSLSVRPRYQPSSTPMSAFSKTAIKIRLPGELARLLGVATCAERARLLIAGEPARASLRLLAAATSWRFYRHIGKSRALHLNSALDYLHPAKSSTTVVPLQPARAVGAVAVVCSDDHLMTSRIIF